jgi:cobyrinic acid a,c-diamide synthase
MKFLFFVLFLFSISSASCRQDTLHMDRKPVEQVFEEHQDELLSIEGVQGFYQGLDDRDSIIIVIMVDELNEKITKTLPDSLEGYPVHIEAGGKIKPLSNPGRNLPEK